MSDQEKKSGSAADTSVVVVEQQTTSRHKQPFRPVDLLDDAQHDSHHNRSKAPALPYDLKDSVINPEVKEKIGIDRAMSSEKHRTSESKHTVSKKQSSSSKRRASSPESVILQPLEVDVKPQLKPDSGTQLAQPIPEVTSKGLDEHKKGYDKKDDEDSITDEIAEMRTPEATRDIEEYEDIPIENVQDVSWNEKDYLDKVQLDDATRSCILESKSSIGPCFRSSRPFGRPSGISLCLSKKSVCKGISVYENNECQMNQSTIMISLSRKCLINKTISAATVRRSENIDIKKVEEKPSSCLTTLRQKFTNVGGKIRNAFA